MFSDMLHDNGVAEIAPVLELIVQAPELRVNEGGN
mgnify:CR=1 FL=1